MKTIQLTQGQVALVDDEDFERLNAFKWQAYFDPKAKSFYAVRKSRVDGKRTTVRMHRVIVNAQPGDIVDHINMSTLDNRRENLRICSNAQNCRNVGKATYVVREQTSGFKGVSWRSDRAKWRVRISVDGNDKTVGHFDDELTAALAYDAAALKLHGEFARTNAMLFGNEIFR